MAEIATTLAPADVEAPLLVDVPGVAKLLLCSTDHVRRMADSGDMPAPIRLRNLIRWKRSTIVEWVDGGCRSPKSKEKSKQ